MIGAYAQLWRIEKSFRMPKHDLAARPIYHHKRESIDAHINIVFARPGRHPPHRGPHRLVDLKFAQTARRYRTVQIRAGDHLLTAEDPIPPELRDALAQIL